MGLNWQRRQVPTTFLGALRNDVRGNTLALMAAALIPFVGLVGGGVDLARIYITKTRLQHACDAGALAGRKAMGGGTWSQNSYAPRTSAEEFFKGNFGDGSYGSINKIVNFTENAGKVTGNVSVDLPMALMQVFGIDRQNIAVTCDAEMRLPNTDVMFVLDTTGSMAQKIPGDKKNKIKIAGLKDAVKCFYEIVARLDTDGDCDGTPSGGTGTQVQIRFGFVPYATNVNVGAVLKPEWLADKWTYQSREIKDPNGDWSDWTDYQMMNCGSVPSNGPKIKYRISANYFWSCQVQYSTKVYWRYRAVEQDVSALKTGSTWPRTTTMPIGDFNTAKTVSWEGCIEERKTSKATSYDPLPSNTYDLDINKVPTGDNDTKWGMVLPDAIYTRQNTDGSGTNSWNAAEVGSTHLNFRNTSSYACPVAAQKLRAWPDATAFDNYVNSLTPEGNTYHDIGLIWGARLMSPNGIFKSENEYTPKGGEIMRHVIFMTDGDTNAQVNDYVAYGVPYFDRRQTDASRPPTKTELDDQVNARFLAVCKQIKDIKNTTLWVISFGDDTSTATKNRLTQCASTGRFTSAADTDTLMETFRKIANEISQLRLVK